MIFLVEIAAIAIILIVVILSYFLNNKYTKLYKIISNYIIIMKRDYSKTIIFKIVCNDLNIKDLYIGSTTDFIRFKAFLKRTSLNNFTNLLYKTINENGTFANWSVIEIEKFPCVDGNEAKARIRYYEEIFTANLSKTSFVNTQALNIMAAQNQHKSNYHERIKEYL